MKSRALLFVIFAGSLMDGILVGGGIDRALVAMPAWHHVGPVGWATFSRHADLGNGLILYPLEAFGGMILSVAATILFCPESTAPRAARMPIYAAALFTIGGLLVTLKAAPIMLGVRNLGDDPAALQRAFDDFEFWGALRLASQTLGYFAKMGICLTQVAPTACGFVLGLAPGWRLRSRGTGSTATACCTRRKKSLPRFLERRRLNRKVNSSR
jgi:hypothetical protein